MTGLSSALPDEGRRPVGSRQGSSRPGSAIERWVDEGGSLGPQPRPAAATILRRANELPTDTAAGCRDRAAADIVTAATMQTANGRHRLEQSAAAWVVRADLLQGLEDSYETRHAAALALWSKDEEFEARHQETMNEPT